MTKAYQESAMFCYCIIASMSNENFWLNTILSYVEAWVITIETFSLAWRMGAEELLYRRFTLASYCSNCYQKFVGFYQVLKALFERSVSTSRYTAFSKDMNEFTAIHFDVTFVLSVAFSEIKIPFLKIAF